MNIDSKSSTVNNLSAPSDYQHAEGQDERNIAMLAWRCQ